MRFRWAGRLWREADPARLQDVLKAMVKAKVAWNPTLDIYEASRDLQRAETQPWFAEYLHPTLEKYFKPDPANHGSYFANWSSTDEAYWKENYRIWFQAVRDFERLGGVIGVGEDAGFIYQMYGFGLIRELELHQEAGFQPHQGDAARDGEQRARSWARRRGWAGCGPGSLADVIVRERQSAGGPQGVLPAARRRRRGSRWRRGMDHQGRHPVRRAAHAA